MKRGIIDTVAIALGSDILVLSLVSVMLESERVKCVCNIYTSTHAEHHERKKGYYFDFTS
jgi:hypothetical protein